MTDFPQFVVGTYEEFVLGYKAQYDTNVVSCYLQNQRKTTCAFSLATPKQNYKKSQIS